MSFFDEGDEPSGEARRAPRPRQPAAPRPAAPEHQTLIVRRAVAIGGGVFLLVLLVLVINSCQDNARKNALKDYNDDVARLVEASDEQVGVPLFRLLGRRPDSPLDLQTQINQLRITADEQVSDAEDLDVPDDADDSRQPLLDVLRFRRDGVANIARRVPTALGRQGAGAAVTAIAAQMQQFLASDVIYSQRVYPEIASALRDADVAGLPRRSRFLPNLEWLAPDTVADRLGSTGGTGPDGRPTPGLHGFGLLSTSAGGTALQPGTTNRVAASANLAFDVTFQNQGENDETDVRLRVQILGAGRPITVQRVIEQVRRGAQSRISVPLGRTPPIGRAVRVRVEVVPVPGERKTDNNRQDYPVIFTR